MISPIQFAYPWMLNLLWLIPLWAWMGRLAYARREKRLARFMSPLMQKRLRPPVATRRTTWQKILILAGMWLLLTAAARPRWGYTEQPNFRWSRDLYIVLDVSRSMLATDVHPNRLKRAKADIQDLIQTLRGDRAGLMAFRHKAVLLCPLTTDHAFLRESLEATQIDSAPPGPTDLAEAITKTLEQMTASQQTHQAILLITDGEGLESVLRSGPSTRKLKSQTGG